MATKKKGAKKVKRGACAFRVEARKKGSSFFDQTLTAPVSWRGRDAAVRFAKRRSFAHAVVMLDCGGKKLTLSSCENGKCESLGGGSNKRIEHRHRGKKRYNETLAGRR